MKSPHKNVFIQFGQKGETRNKSNQKTNKEFWKGSPELFLFCFV